jgi:endo-1,4-beta-D-glucanase Y
MNLAARSFGACGLLVLVAALPAGAAAPRRPFPQHTVYAADSIRPSGHSQAALDQHVVAAYQAWKASYLAAAGSEPDGQPRYRVKTAVGATSPTVSEGQGYGMVIVALLAGAEPQAQTIFDGLWELVHDHPSTIDGRLMDWQVPASEAAQPGNDDSAFDGDADIAFALLLADQQWGSAGRVDYRGEAERVLAGMLASTVGPTSHLPLLGDWVDPAGATYNEFTTRPSDFMPDHFRAFGRLTGDPTWTSVVTSIQAATSAAQAQFAPTTGLLPDFLVPRSAVDHELRPAPPGFLEADSDGDYSYNAGRVPWRLATDALLNGDATSRQQAGKLSHWAESAANGVPDAFAAGYHLDGTPLPGSGYVSSFFLAPLGVAAMLDPTQQAWLDRIYERVRGLRQGYYEDSVTLLSLLVMTGNWWDPTSTAGSCVESATRLCLGGRFAIEVAWQTPASTGAGRASALTADAGTFWFFDAANVELLVKVLDGCAVNGHHWLFTAGLTDVGVTLTASDTASGEVRVQSSPRGTAFPPTFDTTAFGCP